MMIDMFLSLSTNHPCIYAFMHASIHPSARARARVCCVTRWSFFWIKCYMFSQKVRFFDRKKKELSLLEVGGRSSREGWSRKSEEHVPERVTVMRLWPHIMTGCLAGPKEDCTPMALSASAPPTEWASLQWHYQLCRKNLEREDSLLGRKGKMQIFRINT